MEGSGPRPALSKLRLPCAVAAAVKKEPRATRFPRRSLRGLVFCNRPATNGETTGAGSAAQGLPPQCSQALVAPNLCFWARVWGVVAGGAQHSVTVPLNAFLSKERCGDAACSATRCRRRCWAGECCWGLTAAIAALPQLRQSCRLPLTARSAQTVYGGPERFSAASPGSKLRIKCNPKPADCSASVVSAALCGCSSCNGPWPNPPAC